MADEARDPDERLVTIAPHETPPPDQLHRPWAAPAFIIGLPCPLALVVFLLFFLRQPRWTAAKVRTSGSPASGERR